MVLCWLGGAAQIIPIEYKKTSLVYSFVRCVKMIIKLIQDDLD